MEYTGVSNILGAAGLAEQEIIHDYTICTMYSMVQTILGTR